MDSEDADFQAIMDAQREEGWGITPAMEKTSLAEWTLDKDGLALKACATKKPTGAEYGLIIARRNEFREFVEPRNLRRVQLETVRDFIDAVLKDSED